jgi:hypothetical protein
MPRNPRVQTSDWRPCTRNGCSDLPFILTGFEQSDRCARHLVVIYRICRKLNRSSSTMAEKADIIVSVDLGTTFTGRLFLLAQSKAE